MKLSKRLSNTTEFPALDRATQLYQCRKSRHKQVKNHGHDDQATKQWNGKEQGVYEKSMKRLCLLIDRDVKSIEDNVQAIENETLKAVESLTISLELAMAKWEYPTFNQNASHPPKSISSRNAGCLITIRNRKSSKYSRRSIRKIIRQPAVTKALLNGCISSKIVEPRETYQQSFKEIFATTIQQCFRTYVYSNLYKGGKLQLYQAQHMRNNLGMSKVWTRWKQYIFRRRKLAQRRLRVSYRLIATKYKRCQCQAIASIKEGGKYEAAKIFYNTSRLTEMFVEWLLFDRTQAISQSQ